MNPAQRLLHVANAIKEEKDTTQNGIKIWHTIFSKIHETGTWDEQSIAATLLALYDQTELLQEELEDQGVPKKIYVSYLNQFKDALKPSLLPGRWSEIHQKIHPPTLHILEWISLYLGNQEEIISESDFNELISSLNELDALIAEAGLPRALRRLIQKNAKEIREAMQAYPIAGAASLKDAISHIAGDFMFYKEDLESAMASPDIKVKEVCSKFLGLVKKTASTFNYTVKTGENAAKIGRVISNLLLLSS